MVLDAQHLLPEPLRSQQVTQVGMIVPNLGESLRIWSALLGRDDWLVYTYGPETVPVLTYRGRPGAYRMRVAFTGDPLQIELVEPLTGPSVYHEWVERHGYGLHHLAFRVPSLAAAIDQMKARGIEVLQSGSGYGVGGDGGYAYFDTERLVGVICEVIEAPAVRRPSERLADL